MIYIGMEITKYSVNLVALTDAYTPLGNASFRKRHTDKIKRWLRTISHQWDEQRVWFIDESLFYKYDDKLNLLLQLEQNSQFYLVSHRSINEIINTFHDYALFVTGKTQLNGTAFFLASAKRLLPEKSIHFFDIELERIF